MRYASLRALEKHMESAAPDSLASVYTCLIPDPAERSWIVDRIRPYFSRYRWCCWSLERGIPQELGNYSSFWQESELWYLQHCEALSKEQMHRFVELLPHIRCPLLLSGHTLSRTSALYKAVEKQGIILDLTEEKPWERLRTAQDWLTHQVQQSKKKISPTLLQRLVQGTKGHYAFLSNEWEKLKLYHHDQEVIDRVAFESIAILEEDEPSWNLVDALAARDKARAVTIGEAILHRGQGWIALLRQLRHQYQQLLYVWSAQQMRQPDLVAKRYPYLKGNLLEKAVHHAQKLQEEKLVAALLLLDQAETVAKESDMYEEGALALLIAQL